MDTVTPLTAEQRRELIERPIRIRTIGGSRHGGTGVASDDGLHRTYTPRIAAEDENPSLSGARTDGE
jgi:hypothetical protein